MDNLNSETYILHDFVNDFYNAHFDDKGKVLSDKCNALLKLKEMESYINDLIEVYASELDS